MDDSFDRVAALKRDGQPFAMATVVARRLRVSAHLDDRAIVFADGRMDGFVGGACLRELIRTQALEALRTRAARLVSIRPEANEAAAPTSERVVVPMTCASKGAVDVYVEPIVRPRTIVVAGAAPMAAAVARIARAMRYDVVRVVDDAEQGDVAAAIDPVCHMAVNVATATHVAQVDDTSYYFCCAGCRGRFVKDPQRYLSPAS